MANAVAVRVEDTLRPVIGTVLATVSVDVESMRLGKTPDTLEIDDLEAMADNLLSALTLVVGAEMADVASRRVRELAAE